MKGIITPEENKIISDYCLQNPDATVQEIMNKFSITKDIAFVIVCDTAKKLK